MRSDQLKIFTGVVAALASAATFILFSDLDINKNISWAVATMASLYVAGFSLLFTRRLERRRAKEKRVFIIHAREDVDSALEIAHKLKEEGFNPWLDIIDILPGQRWEKAVQHALEESAIALFLSSENTTNSDGYFNKEIQYVMSSFRVRNELDSPVIPVRLDDSELPDELVGIQWIDYSPQGTDKLTHALQSFLLKDEAQDLTSGS